MTRQATNFSPVRAIGQPAERVEDGLNRDLTLDDMALGASAPVDTGAWDSAYPPQQPTLYPPAPEQPTLYPPAPEQPALYPPPRDNEVADSSALDEPPPYEASQQTEA